MAKVKLTPMQELYKKQIRRLRRAISREFRKTGVQLDSSLIPEMPKRVTQKRLQEIKSIKPKDLRRQSQYVDYETGEIIDYETAKNMWQNQQEIATPYELDFTQTVIDSFYDSVSKYNTDFQSRIKTWISSLINQHGKDAVAQMLMDGAEAGVLVTNKIAYSDTACSEFMSEMMEYLNMDARTKADILGEIEATVGFEEPE